MPTRAKLANNPIETAWAAGFLDGEGYVGVTRNFNKPRGGKVYYRVMLAAGQIHEAPMQTLKDMFGGRVNFRKNNHKGCWEWRVFGETAYEAIRSLMPYMKVKRQQCELVLQFGAISVNGRTGKGRYRTIPADVELHRRAIWAALVELNGGRALQAERLSEEAPSGTATKDDAIVRPHGNGNHESCPEMANRLPN